MHVHNAHAPIVIKLDCFHRGARLIQVDCRRLAYLSACGKYLQLSMYGASRLEPPLT